MAAAAPSDWFPKRGEVYWVRLDKQRPAVILSVDALNRHAADVCVVPLTRIRRKQFVLRVQISASEGGLRSECWAKCDQVTTIEKTGLVYPPLGTLPLNTLRQIEKGVRLALGLIEA